jgi:prophage regulatory protein
MDELLRTWRILAEFNWSRSTLWRRVRAGDFPAPIKLSPNIVAWIPDEVATWRKSRPRGGYGARWMPPRPTPAPELLEVTAPPAPSPPAHRRQGDRPCRGDAKPRRWRRRSGKPRISTA